MGDFSAFGGAEKEKRGREDWMEGRRQKGEFAVLSRRAEAKGAASCRQAGGQAGAGGVEGN